ncbi:MAG TPA: PHP domain-containing protein [Kofleriaceae bacterium]|nr:PHP domain-containing protein [Kofleriaceae bacterium]
MSSLAIAARLREIAAYLVLEGDRFRARAYEKAARSLEGVKDLDRLIAERRLTELPRIGPSLAGAIEELSRRGTIDLLERLREKWPKLVLELADLGGVGPGRALALQAALAPADLDELAEMCRAGRVRAVQGFGPAAEARLLDAIERRHQRGHPLALAEARQLSAALAGHLLADGAAMAADPAGAARRWVEISDRLSLAAATRDPVALAAHLGRHPQVVSVDRAPDSDHPHVARFLARLASGVLCELVAAPPERYGTAMVVATGSAAHLDQLRSRAGAAGLALEEIAAADEPALYRALGLPWLPPEVRDGSDELAAADAGDDFADLVALADVAGSVHCHTTYSDGKHSVEQMARAAAALGHSYITITDHSPTAHYAGGLTVERLAQQWAEIGQVEQRVGIRILRGTESDIRADGGLDYPDSVLATMDVVIASVHQRYRLDEEAMTRRLVAAMRQPVFKIWGHALGRLLMHRDPIAVRFDEVLDAIADSPAAIEINGDPRRLDLEPERARRARARGVRFVLSSDAHSTDALVNVEYAVALARRARLRRADVLNTLPADEFCRAVQPLAR